MTAAHGKVRILDAIVQTPAHLTLIKIARLTRGGGAGFLSIGDDLFTPAVKLPRAPLKLRSLSVVPFPGHKGLQDFAFVIYRVLQTVKLTTQLHVNLVEMPTAGGCRRRGIALPYPSKRLTSDNAFALTKPKVADLEPLPDLHPEQARFGWVNPVERAAVFNPAIDIPGQLTASVEGILDEGLDREIAELYPG